MDGTLLDYLGKPAAVLLESQPFRSWTAERSIEEDLPEVRIYYEYEEQGLSLSCDADSSIRAIFLEWDQLASSLMELPFSFGRGDVIKLLGEPSKSGAAHKDPILGDYGPWDRFDSPLHSIHVEFEPKVDRIRRITLMRADTAP